MLQNLPSAAVLIGALRVNPVKLQHCSVVSSYFVENNMDPDQMALSEAS